MLRPSPPLHFYPSFRAFLTRLCQVYSNLAHPFTSSLLSLPSLLLFLLSPTSVTRVPNNAFTHEVTSYHPTDSLSAQRKLAYTSAHIPAATSHRAALASAPSIRGAPPPAPPAPAPIAAVEGRDDCTGSSDNLAEAAAAAPAVIWLSSSSSRNWALAVSVRRSRSWNKSWAS